MPAFSVGDLTLHYREVGAGPLLLVLPGNTASSACHDGEMAHFSGRFRTVAPDLRGTGQSTRLAAWPDDWYRSARTTWPPCSTTWAPNAASPWAPAAAPSSRCGWRFCTRRVTAVIADSTAAGYPPAWLCQAMATRSARSPGQVAFWQGAHGADWAQVVEQDTLMLLRIADRGGDFFGGRLAEIACPVLLTASLGDSVLYDVGPAQLAMAAALPDSRLFLAKQGDHPLMWSNAGEFRRVADAYLAQWALEEKEE